MTDERDVNRLRKEEGLEKVRRRAERAAREAEETELRHKANGAAASGMGGNPKAPGGARAVAGGRRRRAVQEAGGSEEETPPQRRGSGFANGSAAGPNIPADAAYQQGAAQGGAHRCQWSAGHAAPKVEVTQYELRDKRAIPTRAWIIRSLVLRQHITEMMAASGVGKSTIGLAVAAHAAAGRNFGRFKVRRRQKVAFLSVEEDRDEVDRRFAGIAEIYGFTQEDLAGHLFRITITDPIALATVDKKGIVGPTPALAELREKLQAEGFDLIIIDPFVEVWEGQENDNMQVRAAGSMLRALARELNAGCLLMHHVRKGTVTPGDLDAGRGGSSLGGIARLAFTLISMTKEMGELLGLAADKVRGKLRLDRAKGSYLPPAAEADWFEFVEVDMENMTDAEPDSDTVGVLKPWHPPGIFADLSFALIDGVLNRIAGGVLDDNGEPTGDLWSKNKRATSRWAGAVLMDGLGWDEKKAYAGVKKWIETGLLYDHNYNDRKGHPTTGLKVDEAHRPSGEALYF